MGQPARGAGHRARRADGRFQKFARGYRTLSFVVLGLALLPFLWVQVRYALYPQLEAQHERRTASTRERDPGRGRADVADDRRAV